MAKLLAFKRSTANVVTVDTVNGIVEDLGSAVSGADTTSSFPNRCENLVAVFRGDVYLLYRTTTNEVRLSLYDSSGGTWSDVSGFTAITTGGGVITPQSLQVVRNRLVATATLSSSGGTDQVIARRSDPDDGSTWDPTTTLNFSGATDSRAGPTITWHNAVFMSSAEGICAYDPDGDSFVVSFDQGDDSGITDRKTNFGAFTPFDGDLYYVLPTDNASGSPSLYKLDKTWSVSAPTPVFINESIVIPGTGSITVGNDTGNYSLFVNTQDQISLLYSGSLGSKLVVMEPSGASLNVTDVTSSLLPSQFSGESGIGFSVYVDDRRRSNEKQTVIVRLLTAVPQVIALASWDGTNAVKQTATLDDSGSGLDLMVVEDERSDARTFTDNQPSVFIDTFSQPFPGRVRIDYTVRDDNSRTIDVTPEYSIDNQTWLAMTQGDDDDGITGLTSTPSGSSYFFNWDAFADLDGDSDHVDIRVVARISGT